MTPGRVPLWLKLAWSLWMAVWIPVYWLQHGPANFLWLCDVANFVIAAALWLESPLLMSSQAVGVLAIQLAWATDFLGRLILGVHPLGGTEYMFDPGEATGRARAVALSPGRTRPSGLGRPPTGLRRPRLASADRDHGRPPARELPRGGAGSEPQLALGAFRRRTDLDAAHPLPRCLHAALPAAHLSSDARPPPGVGGTRRLGARRALRRKTATEGAGSRRLSLLPAASSGSFLNQGPCRARSRISLIANASSRTLALQTPEVVGSETQELLLGVRQGLQPTVGELVAGDLRHQLPGHPRSPASTADD